MMGVAATLGQTWPQGLPGTLAGEVLSVASLPQVSYTEVLALEAEKAPCAHNVGKAVEDAQASGGQAWGCEVGADEPGHLLYGPYVDLKPGDYVAFFRVRISEPAHGDRLGSLDAFAPGHSKVLVAKALLASDHMSAEYVQVPLAFSHPGGPLECRLFWSGDYSLRVDKLTVFSLSGGHVEAPSDVRRVPLAAPSGEPKDLAYVPRKPTAELFPKSKTPDSHLIVFDLRKQPQDWQFALSCLQGLVNRERPRIYFITGDKDQQWLDWMLKRGWVKTTEELKKPEDVFARFGGVVKGAVIPDSSLPATRNVATMVAGVEEGVVASPRLVKKLSLPVLADLRGRWKTSVAAYRWAYETLWPKMNHAVLACLWPDSVELRDYLVENNIFIFWIPGVIDGAEAYSTPGEEIRFVEELLAQTPANTPIMGYPWAGLDVGMGEGPGVTLFSEFGKYLVGSVGSSDLSVHSGVRIASFRQPVQPAPALAPDKVYVCFAISDGDNLPVVSGGNWPQLWESPTRGKLPMGWTISPAATVLIPGIVDYYYATATSNETFMAAVSGVGYCYPDFYGTRYRESDRASVLDDFLAQTEARMRAMDLRAVCPSQGVNVLRRFAEKIPYAQSLFPDYGRIVKSYTEATFATVHGTPVFRATTTWDPEANREKQIQSMVSQIREMAASNRPAFLHLFVCNWFWDLPALKEAFDQLGPDYVAVGPDQLAALYRQEMERHPVQVQVAGVVCFEGQDVKLNATLLNASAKDFDVSVDAVAGVERAVVKPSPVRLKSGEDVQVALSGKPSGDAVRLRVNGSFGALERTVNLCLVRDAELAESLPARGGWASIGLYEAENLGHQPNSGVLDKEADASGGAVWSARKGTDRAACIAYGPYAALEKGDYVALFRLKRTGEGDGQAARLDACVGGGSPETGKRDVAVGDLPLNVWRWFPVAFHHPGGSIETRVHWSGNASLAVDAVAVWRTPSPETARPNP